jgi:hypothetical protein
MPGQCSTLRSFEQPGRLSELRDRSIVRTLLGFTWLSAGMPDVASGLMGSPLPLRPLLAQAPEVFARSGVRKNGLFPDDPFVAFGSPPESLTSRSRPAGWMLHIHPARLDSLASFFPYSVLTVMGSHILPRVSAPWVTVPPQRFSRSRGIDPPIPCRPCFVPVPLLGFCLSRSFSSCRAVRPLGRPYPLAVERECEFAIQLQGFRPCTSPRLDRFPPVRTATSIGFCLPEVSPFSSWDWWGPALVGFAGTGRSL